MHCSELHDVQAPGSFRQRHFAPQSPEATHVTQVFAGRAHQLVSDALVMVHGSGQWVGDAYERLDSFWIVSTRHHTFGRPGSAHWAPSRVGQQVALPTRDFVDSWLSPVGSDLHHRSPEWSRFGARLGAGWTENTCCSSSLAASAFDLPLPAGLAGSSARATWRTRSKVGPAAARPQVLPSSVGTFLSRRPPRRRTRLALALPCGKCL